MPLSEEAQAAIREKTKEYLRSLDSGQWAEIERFVRGIKHNAPWKELVITAFEQSKGRINEKFLKEVDWYIRESLDNEALSETMAEQLSEKYMEQIRYAYDRELKVFVPLSNIKLIDVDNIQLNTCILRAGSHSTDFAEAVSGDESLFLYDGPDDLCYLEMIVYGDNESIKHEVRINVEDALKVLRFVSWTHSNPKKITESEQMNSGRVKYVASYPHSDVIGYYAIVSPDKNSLKKYYGGSIEIIQRHVINKTELAWMRRFGLDDLNNALTLESKIAEQIQVALDWYDNGQKALRFREAMSYYVLCVNSLLSWGTKGISNGSELKNRLSALIENTVDEDMPDFYFTTGFPDHVPSDTPVGKVITAMAQNIGEIFEDYYSKYRGAILHGLPSPGPNFPLTLEEVKTVETIAFNALRLMAKLIRKEGFSDKSQIEHWLEAKSRAFQKLVNEQDS